MPLESLLELIQTLSHRIDQHGPALRQSEALTRYALIDPLLRELGWDTANPARVIPEYRSGNGRADYALMNNGSPAMMLEAKSLGTPLQDTVLSQGINYCLMEGTGYFAVTDGRLWEIYETHKPVPIDEKRIVSFDLKDNPTQVCLKALALWRHGIESGQVSVAQIPVVEPTQSQPNDRQAPTIEEPVTQPTPVASSSGGTSWIPLSEFNPSASARPTEMLFPNNSTARLRSWGAITTEAIRWLMNKNILTPTDFPIQYSRARTRYVADTTPAHPSGEPFADPDQVGSYFVETNTSKGTIIRQTCELIEHIRQDPYEFKVRLP